MVIKPKYPNNEYELVQTLNNLYIQAKATNEKSEKPRFKGLLEVIKSEANILTSIHKIKANKGSKTAGSDEQTIRDILNKSYNEVLDYVKDGLNHHSPLPVRRKWIDKAGKKEKRPLGIPAIGDRIIQECVRNVIEPIFEAQFYEHSYGFRPYRDTRHAIARVEFLAYRGYHWAVEGDISKFFDKVNHNILIKKLWGMGIEDKRVLMIIKQMLKAGVMNETSVNEIGTPQGGIISPLLANVYLNSMDNWITREWEKKETKFKYKTQNIKLETLRLRTNLKPAYLIRYADDWVLLTNSRTNALKWKERIANYLTNNLKIELSAEKTKVTNMRKKAIEFLGYDISLRRKDGQKKYHNYSVPNPIRFKAKLQQIKLETQKIRKQHGIEQSIDQINKVNSIIRGVAQYYQYAQGVNKILEKRANFLEFTAYRAVQRYGGKLVPANEVSNLIGVHEKYTTGIPAIQYKGLWVGVTRLNFIVWEKAHQKNQKETPYTQEGKKLYNKRTKTKSPLRADELLSLHLSKMIALGAKKKLYNFEFFLNRAYVFNRDKGKCKICREDVDSHNLHIHHNSPKLPIVEVNRVAHLSTVCEECHVKIHSKLTYNLPKTTLNRLTKYREKLAHTKVVKGKITI